MKTVTIEVTQEDINVGVKRCAGRCPIACALRRHFPMLTPCVAGGEADLEHPWDGTVFSALLPSDAKWFISIFDEGLPVVPFAFDLEFPEEVFDYANPTN